MPQSWHQTCPWVMSLVTTDTMAYPGGFSGCPETPPPAKIFFNQRGDTVTGTDPDRPLTFATFGNPPSDQLWIRHWESGTGVKNGSNWTNWLRPGDAHYMHGNSNWPRHQTLTLRHLYMKHTQRRHLAAITSRTEITTWKLKIILSSGQQMNREYMVCANHWSKSNHN